MKFVFNNNRLKQITNWKQIFFRKRNKTTIDKMLETKNKN